MPHQVLNAWHLGTGEKKDYTINLNSELEEGETVTSVELFADPADITIENLSVSAGVVLFWASAPKAATGYYITARGTLNNQRIVENTIVLAGIEKAHGEVVATWP